MEDSTDLRSTSQIEERTRDDGLRPRAFPEGIIALVELGGRAGGRGTIPLFHMLVMVSSGGGPVVDTVNDTSIERRTTIIEGYAKGISYLLSAAKQDIREGKLKIYHLPSLVQINGVPDIVAWLNEPAALEIDLPEMMDRIGGLGSVVVKIEDARQWINEKGLTVPELLRDFFSAAVDEGDVPKGLARSTRDSSKLATLAALMSLYPKSKLPSAKDLEKAAATVGVEISDDTIRNVTSEVMEFAPKLLPK